MAVCGSRAFIEGQRDFIIERSTRDLDIDFFPLELVA